MTDVQEIEYHLHHLNQRLSALGDIDSHIVELTDQVALLASAAQAIADRS
tara:strand:+ start:1006 stop:1155 length:150 start_codon:yes stop_codon:yes gene_type:complete